MAFKKVSTRGNIGGFWTREEGTTLVGQVKKFIKTDMNGYFLIETVEGDVPLQGKDEDSQGRQSVMGELIAVSSSLNLECLKTFLNEGIVRLTSMGKKRGKGANSFWDIEVEHDPEGKPYKGEINYNDEGLPF